MSKVLKEKDYSTCKAFIFHVEGVECFVHNIH